MKEPERNRNRMSLPLDKLNKLYSEVSKEEAIEIANVGAECYIATKKRLYAVWESTHDDIEKEELWRKEGSQAMLESLKMRLAAGEAAQERLAVLQSIQESEINRRVTEQISLNTREAELKKREEKFILESRIKEKDHELDQMRKDGEREKQRELFEKEKEILELKASSRHVETLETAIGIMKEDLKRVNDELTKYREAAQTKSSHTLGRIGETTVLDMLQKHVMTKFMYSEVVDMTKVKHAGDFHLFVNGPTGKRVRILIDVKKYASPVSLSEIEKLYNDLDRNEVDIGLLLSLDSAIATKTSFQLTKTKSNKPCMFLSFKGLDDGVRQEVLCWAVQVLAGVVSTHDNSSQDLMVSEIQKFLVDLNTELEAIDGCVKAARSQYEMLREVRERIAGRIKDYKITCGMEAVPEAITVAELPVDMKCKANNKNGTQCKSRRVPASLFCARHNTVETVVVL